MTNRSVIFTTLILIVFLAGGTIFFLFWRLNVLKKEPELSPTFFELKSQVEYAKNYPFAESSNYLRDLSTEIMVLPTITPEEIGRQSLF